LGDLLFHLRKTWAVQGASELTDLDAKRSF
jgi:hypothetical protein